MSEATKNRWPLGIVLTIGIFLLIMFGVVGFLMTQDVNLVTDKYYEKELAYQARIKAIERTRALGADAGIEMSAGAVIVRLPKSAAPPAADGKILLYRPSDRSSDRTLAVTPDSAGRQVIPFGTLASGLWRVQVQWTMRGDDYYLEQPFMVP